MNVNASAPDRRNGYRFFLKPWDFWAFVLPLLAMSPMLVFQWQTLMIRPERQFFPALIAVALFFPLRALLGQYSARNHSLQLDSSRKSTSSAERGLPYEHRVPVVRLAVAVAALQVALLVYALSVWAFSPWLVHVAAILVFFAWALGRCTDSSWSSVLAWSGLLAITLPLPLSYDTWLVSSLQSASSWACSMALDALGVPHLRLANVIEMRGRQLFIEEACSGIGSMYALLAAAGLLVLINRRSLLVATLTLASVPVWAMLGNFLRLLTVALGHHYYQRDLSHGLDHELLGVMTFGVAAFGLWMTEWMVASWFQPIPPTADEYAYLFRTINKCLCWPNEDPFSQTHELELDGRRVQAQRDADRVARLAAERRVSPWDAKPIRLLLHGGAVLALILAIAPTIVLARGSAADVLTFALPEFTQADLARFPNADSMPEQLGGWKRVDFRSQHRSTSSLFGAHSQIWEYARGEQRMLLSLDFPFRGAHPLEHCYRGTGWTIDELNPMPSSDDDQQWEWREVSMSNELGTKACVYYAAFTEDGQTYAISQAEAVTTRFNRRLGQVFSSRAPAYQPVCYQVQVLYEGGTQLSESERSDLREVFLAARTELLARIRTLR